MSEPSGPSRPRTLAGVALPASVVALALAIAYHAAVLRHETTHPGGPLIVLTDRLTGFVESCRLRLDVGPECHPAQHLEGLVERGARLEREAKDSTQK